jgi:hypothetical protein
MRIPSLLVVIALALFSTSIGFAEETPGPPQPTAEHKALGKFVGKWAGSGELKPGPFGPGGTMEWTEDCSWFGGNEFQVVCKSKGTGPMGPMQGLGIMSYNPAKKVYVHFGVDSTGWTNHAEGTHSGDSWTFQSEETMEGKTFHSRFTMTLKSATEMAFTFDMSEDGKNWMTLMDGTSKKQ